MQQQDAFKLRTDRLHENTVLNTAFARHVECAPIYCCLLQNRLETQSRALQVWYGSHFSLLTVRHSKVC